MIKIYIEITTPISLDKLNQLQEQFGVHIDIGEHFYEIKAPDATVLFYLGKNWPTKL